MSFLPHALLTSDSPTQVRSAQEKGVNTGDKKLRKAQSHASLVSPLLRLARNPTESLGGIIESFWVGEPAQEDVVKTQQTEDDLQTRRLIWEHRMKDATKYSAWREAALELDAIEGNNDWKAKSESSLYNSKLLEERITELNEVRITNDPNRILHRLRTSLTRSLGNMGDLKLYKHSHIGTKTLIEEYISAACGTIESLLECLESSETDHRDTLEQLLAARQSFGRSALLLSGGGTFGMTHIGVVKTLWEENMLPRIISGSSAGSIISAVLCARTDAEIPDTLKEMCSGQFNVFEDGTGEDNLLRKAARFAKFGALFDIQHLIGVMKGLLGDLTFQEAYNRTRRILNISVSSASLHELPRLLNYITAPNVIIWSAVAASCSVPLVFSPAVIYAKDPKDGAEVPWNPSAQLYIDGSVDNDLPMTRLAEMFNVNHFIVSQVNPHVVPFLVGEDAMHSAAAKGHATAVATGSSWLNTLASFAKSEALHRMHVLTELGVFPTYLTKLRSVLNQKYSGDITILPEISYTQFPKVLSNPSSEFMLEAMLSGQRATWPKLSRIQNHCAIELALDAAVQKLRAHIAFSPSQVDLRLLSLAPSQPHNHSLARGRRLGTRTRSKTKSWCSDPRRPPLGGLSHSFNIRTDPASRAKFRDALVEIMSTAATDSSTTATGEISESSDDDDEEEENSYLKMQPARRRRTQIASDPIDIDSSTSNPSNLRSYSPSSDPGSPEMSPPSRPTLWPTTRQLFPASSTPATPSGDATLRWSITPAAEMQALPRAGVDLTMTSSAPAEQPDGANETMSEVERRYKRLFHGRRDILGEASQDGKHLTVDVSGTRGIMRRKRSSGLKE